MTGSQYIELKNKVLGLWGNTSKWPNEAYQVTDLIRNAEFRWCDAAIDQFISDGVEYTPSIPRVLKRARELAPRKPVLSGTECDHALNRWAIVEEHPDGTRVGLCTGCRWEKTFVPGELVTDGGEGDRG